MNNLNEISIKNNKIKLLLKLCHTNIKQEIYEYSEITDLISYLLNKNQLCYQLDLINELLDNFLIKIKPHFKN
jgi:hypothetical protein